MSLVVFNSIWQNGLAAAIAYRSGGRDMKQKYKNSNLIFNFGRNWLYTSHPPEKPLHETQRKMTKKRIYKDSHAVSADVGVGKVMEQKAVVFFFFIHATGLYVRKWKL
jgi:hypothetical protein